MREGVPTGRMSSKAKTLKASEILAVDVDKIVPVCNRAEVCLASRTTAKCFLFAATRRSFGTLKERMRFSILIFTNRVGSKDLEMMNRASKGSQGKGSKTVPIAGMTSFVEGMPLGIRI